MSRIRQISIKNLFGIFDHDIKLNMDERVTIIHSPNGFGKTAILKLLYELFTQGTRVIRNTPFDELHIYFEDHTHFWIEKEFVEVDSTSTSRASVEAGKRTRLQIVSYCSDAEGKSVSSLELTDGGSSIEQLSIELVFLEGSLRKAVQERDTLAADACRERILDIESRISMMQADRAYVRHMVVPRKISSPDKEQSWFQTIRESVPVRFIETQRLLNSTREASSQGPTRRPVLTPAVTLYSDELSKTITAKLADSTPRSQELDRTFPGRLVDLATRQSDISESELRGRLAELEAKRKSLMAVGLVDQNPGDAVLTPHRIDASTKAVLSLYVEDTRQKLAAFDDIAPKIELFTRIINKRFLYKEMSISRKDGFVFTTPKGTRLALENLSSGEQHELVLFYELLFKSSPGSLIMIDEPEISLHVVWQEQFLRDVQDITRLADIDVLIATHSPDIIDGHRALVVELEGPNKKTRLYAALQAWEEANHPFIILRQE